MKEHIIAYRVDKNGFTDTNRDVYKLCELCEDAETPTYGVGYDSDPSDLFICEKCLHEAIVRIEAKKLEEGES